MDRIPVLLDTDIGSNIDDALALAYLLRQPRCELLGVTTVSGDVVKRAACAEVLCREAGRDDIAIHCGAPGPLLTGTGQTAVPLYPAIARHLHRTDRAVGTAPEFMRKLIRRLPGEVTLLTIGPLTNVALLFALDPEVPSLLKAIVSMAGVYYAHEKRVETNVLIDPVATAMVFRATARAGSAPHTLVGLSVTTPCNLPADQFRTRHRAAVPPAPVLAEMAEPFLARRRHVTFNDPLAAAVVFAPDLCTYEGGVVTMKVDQPGEDAARTYFAADRTAPDRPAPHRVARGVKLDRFFDEYFSAFCGTLTAGDLPPGGPSL